MIDKPRGLHAQGTWAQQDTWMDFYRKRFGPDEGYGGASPSHPGRSTQSSPGGARGARDHYLVDYHSPQDTSKRCEGRAFV